MSDQQRAMNFGELAQEVRDPVRRWGREKLAIWGGWCTEADVLTLLKQWPEHDTAMPYRIWEYASEIVFEERTLPAEVRWLERGRLFGSGGDLALRRDGDRFRWRFVGPDGACSPDGFDAKDFWRTEPEARFHENKETALLWGERKEDFDLWFEDRTARAKLKYPWDRAGRVQVKYQTFSRAGRVEFVWLLGLEAYDG